MSITLNKASAIAVAATLFTAILSANGSGAIAQSKSLATIEQQPTMQSTSASEVPSPVTSADAATALNLQNSATTEVNSLAALVAVQAQPVELPRELNCLASAIYFEAKSESLAGQLAVGRVVVERSKSGRFPASYCGVVLQPSQFSFVRGHVLPNTPKASPAWKDAVAIAMIANNGTWASPAEGALFFHATRVSPRWRLTRVARVDSHVFYR